MNLSTLIRTMILTVFLLAFTSHVQLYAQPYESSKSYKVQNAQQAARMVKARLGGKVLKVQTTKVKGNLGYRVKVLKDNGHVVSVKVDAVTGQISGK